MARSCNSTNIVTLKTDLEEQLVMHKLNAASNTQRQNLYFQLADG